jgi:hypothetical protein
MHGKNKNDSVQARWEIDCGLDTGQYLSLAAESSL